MIDHPRTAPGAPGIPPRWTSSSKSGIGTSLGLNSKVWFTLSHGIVNEVYYPRLDQACTRDLGFLVTGDGGFFSEEKRSTASTVSMLQEGVPAYRLENVCTRGQYRIEKEILTDPLRDVLLQRVRFTPLTGACERFRLYLLLAPHLANYGAGNSAWVGEYKGVPMMFAERDDTALAIGSGAGWLRRSVGFVGVSDGWQDIQQNRRMAWSYDEARNGNVAITGEIDITAACEGFVVGLGFGRNAAEAGHRVRASILDGFDAARSAYCAQWRDWHRSLVPVKASKHNRRDLYALSLAVLRTHLAPNFPGSAIASLSVPWGFARSDDDLGGYHLVWPRDLVETAGGLLAAGSNGDVRDILQYLQITQEKDGHWAQNMWIDGTPYWQGVQMDETAFPILLVGLARREHALDREYESRLWPMVRKAASFCVVNGPVTQEDRWEEDPGYSPFTLSAEIAALLVAADMADENGEPRLGVYLRETADAWNDMIERWIYVTGSELGRSVGVDGYYVRVSPADTADASSPMQGYVPIKNRPPGESSEPAANIVSPDALALVRFGLRAPDDPRIRNTIRVIDALLRVDTPAGPCWHRYNNDGYGEHDDGSPFDGTGVGRAWPLLTGERAHYELADGRTEEARTLMGAMESFAGEGGLLPEQIWDAPDIPSRELQLGKPSGSAMPLVWAHAEYLKLRRSLADGRVFDTPEQTVQRYQVDRIASTKAVWRFNQKCRNIPRGKGLRIEVMAPATVHWSRDEWSTVNDSPTIDTGIGIHYVDIPSSAMSGGGSVTFTFRWEETGGWEGRNFIVTPE